MESWFAALRKYDNLVKYVKRYKSDFASTN